jgi:GAF domain-containing protein
VPEESRAGFARLALGEAVCGAAAQARRAVEVGDAQASGDPRAVALRALGVRAYVAFPLVAGDRLLGTLSFGARGRGRFSEEETAFLGAIAHHVAVVRERLRAEAALREGEARYRALTRASSDVLYRICPEWAEMRQLSGGGASPTRRARPGVGWRTTSIRTTSRA